MAGRNDDDGGLGRWVPVDLVLVDLLVAALVGASLSGAAELDPVRIALAVVALFLPGYALVAALFPRGPLGDEDRPLVAGQRVRFLDGYTRFVLSFALGLVTTPLLGIAANFVGLPLRLWVILWMVGGFTVLASVVAAVRRARLPPEDRYRPGRRWRATLRATAFERADALDGERLAGVVVALAVLVAAVGIVGIAAVPREGERITELYLLERTDDGELLAADFERDLTRGEPTSLFVGVENREKRTRTYTVVTVLQRVEGDPGDRRVTRQAELDRFSLTLANGRTNLTERTVTPTFGGEDLRLAYLLYRGDPPDRPTLSNAYRETHLWVTVVDSG